MTKQHTPRPWTVGERDSCGKYSPHGECDGGWPVDGPEYGHHGFIVEADAHLIAAAPELLDACRRLLKFNEELCADVKVSKHYPSADFARKAIAKAEGHD